MWSVKIKVNSIKDRNSAKAMAAFQVCESGRWVDLERKILKTFSIRGALLEREA